MLQRTKVADDFTYLDIANAARADKFFLLIDDVRNRHAAC
jgi:hypothetical protein